MAGLARGRFPQLGDREDLWRLLVVITTRGDGPTRRQLREKRGGGLVRPVADVADSDPDNDDDLLARAVSSERTPEFAAMVTEEYRRLLDASDDDVSDRKVAVLRMEGHTNDEIAENWAVLAAPSPANWH